MKQNFWKLVMIAVGSAVFSLGFDLFLDPNGINCGGVSGIAMLIVYGVKTKWLTVGILSALINIPLFFLGYKQIGKYFFFGSLLGMAISSVCFDLFAAILPVPTVDPLVASLFGGVMIGAGLGVVFLAGASTGGVDIVARVLKLKLRNFPIGKIILCMDLCTAVATGIVYRDFNNTLYSIITLVLSSIVLDKVVYGMDFAKVALVVSEKHEQIADAIAVQLERGVTYLDGEGYYSRTDKTVLLTAVKKKQLAQLKEIVMTVDPNAFMILQDAQQVLGDGFKAYDRYEL
ncbi:MAG: YitT family protein [Clostridiales bacterium]|nr:YitT family protein [Clostridiales bacterium]